MKDRSFRLLRLFFLLGILCNQNWFLPPVAGADADVDVEKESDDESLALEVIVLDSKNFDAKVGDGNVWLIEFYTPWCRHCQNFKASYSSVAASFHSSPDEKIRVAKVDCSVERALASRFGLHSYPSFFVVDGWSVYEFSNTRSEAALMDFARGGYKKQDPLPIWSSPMGPMGMLQGSLVYMGVELMGFFKWLQERFGVSPVIAGMLLCGMGVFVGLVGIIIFAIVTTPKLKND